SSPPAPSSVPSSAPSSAPSSVPSAQSGASISKAQLRTCTVRFSPPGPSGSGVDRCSDTTWVPGSTSWVDSGATSAPSSRQASEKPGRSPATAGRSEEHTSEVQSREKLVCRLLLEKKHTNKGLE